MNKAPHSQAMARARAAALERGDWLSTPELPFDYGFCPPSGGSHATEPEIDGSVALLESLRTWVQREPERIACADAAGEWTYAALWAAIARLAREIDATGTPPGPVAILLPADASWPVSLYSCLAAGRAAVVLDCRYPETVNDAAIRGARATLVIAPSDTAFAAGRRLGLPVIALEAALRAPDAPFPPDTRWLGINAPAWIVGTSGSTGTPKAVVHSQRSLRVKMGSWADPLHVGVGDRVLALSSPATITGLTTMLIPVRGAAIELLDLAIAGYRGLLHTLRGRPVTILRGSASVLRGVLEFPTTTLAGNRLRGIATSGEQLVWDDIARLQALLPGVQVLNLYGSTETQGMFWFADPAVRPDPVRIPAGVLSPGVEAMLVDPDGRPVAEDMPGELMLRCAHMAIGEWRDGRLVPGRMQPDQADPRFRIYRTGDLARLTPDGVFILLGRTDRQIKLNGQFVDLAQIEGALRRSAYVAGVAVVAREADGRNRVLAFVEATADAPANLAMTLSNALRVDLPPLMRPARVLVLPALPMLPGGKVDEARLREDMDGIIERAP
jgi:acyl-coenzyme A synthetase/AMP-(fatty) acid ligase